MEPDDKANSTPQTTSTYPLVLISMQVVKLISGNGIATGNSHGNKGCRILYQDYATYVHILPVSYVTGF